MRFTMTGILMSVMVFALAAPALAKGKGGGHRPDKASMSEAPSDDSPRLPPGLSEKDELPKGLEKKDKTPKGWGKGKKRGWWW